MSSPLDWDLVGEQTSLSCAYSLGCYARPSPCIAEPGAQMQFMKIKLWDACSAGQLSLLGL